MAGVDHWGRNYENYESAYDDLDFPQEVELRSASFTPASTLYSRVRFCFEQFLELLVWLFAHWLILGAKGCSYTVYYIRRCINYDCILLEGLLQCVFVALTVLSVYCFLGWVSSNLTAACAAVISQLPSQVVLEISISLKFDLISVVFTIIQTTNVLLLSVLVGAFSIILRGLAWLHIWVTLAFVAFIVTRLKQESM